MAKRVCRAVIFDMDGLMIDSEPLWHVAEQAVFGAAGVELSTEDCNDTTGLRIDEVVAFHAARKPWGDTPTQAEVARGIVDKMVELVKTEGKPMAGLEDALSFFEGKGLPLAVASSSHMVLLEAALEGLGLVGRFKHVISAEHEPYGKPHPGVYITAAKALGVPPENCLALEDSLNGTLAAKAAKMVCISVPEAHNLEDARFAIADIKLCCLDQVRTQAAELCAWEPAAGL